MHPSINKTKRLKSRNALFVYSKSNTKIHIIALVLKSRCIMIMEE
jgi:hypothetical protein